MKSLIIVVLAAALAFVCFRLADVERQRYAMIVGMCPGTISPIDPMCVADAEPRENAAWNLLYGLMP